MRLFKKKYWFITFKIDKLKNGKTIPRFLVKKIQRYFWWRGSKTHYFEPHTGFDDSTTIVFGTAKVVDKTNRNVIIFLMELYASIKDPNKHVTDDFYKKTKKYKGWELNYYKVPEFIWEESKEKE